MVYRIADNITSPLGMTSAQNFQAVKAGRTALASHEGLWDIPEPFTAAILPKELNDQIARKGLTRFESMVIASASEALAKTEFEISSPRVVFILSTTKANVELLGTPMATSAMMHPGESAKRIAKHLGIETEPIVVSLVPMYSPALSSQGSSRLSRWMPTLVVLTTSSVWV